MVNSIGSGDSDYPVFPFIAVMAGGIHRGIIQRITALFSLFVPGGRHYDYAGVISAFYGIFQTSAKTKPDKTEINNISAVGYGVINRFNHIISIALSGIAQNFKRHNFRFPRYSGYAGRVITGSGGYAGHYRAVQNTGLGKPFFKFRRRVGRIIYEIPAINIINKSIFIVINIIIRYFIRALPNIITQIRMINLHPGI